MKSTDIEITDLTFRYVAHGFELGIPRLSVTGGEHVAVVGASGCGKTTLAYLLSGIYVPLSGSVRIGEQLISEMSDAERRNFRISNIGFIFQEFELLEYLRVEENIVLPYFVRCARMDLRAWYR